SFDVWDTPEPLGAFRMADVPLPSPLDPRPRKPPVEPQAVREPEPAGAAQGSLIRRGGGKLAVRVLRQESPAAGGTMHFGLSARAGASSGPVRWIEVPVDKSGVARIEGVRPGRYRLVLRYAPTAAALPSVRAPVEITITAGRELQLPPFRLAATQPPK
ncbi:MAG TPA: hypothetical protein VK689_14915, partial [Armatimonadota bacterium]|nr:hypothetical protein [Armatimonadota bacterium]